MSLPSVEQYATIIAQKNPAVLATLTRYQFLHKQQNGQDVYTYGIGTSAVVFKAEKDDQVFAIRCFLRGGLETYNRYQAMERFLAPRNETWKVPFEFVENEILFEGKFYPVVIMNWVNGTALNHFIEANLHNSSLLLQLQQRLVVLWRNLEDNGIAHGDLKYNNIIVDGADGNLVLKLIDYDSMFIPGFEGKHNLETGSPGFQPLKRLATHFSAQIDRFSVWVLLASLEAVKTDPQIWKDVQHRGFNNENSIFTTTDFLQPGQSKLIAQLYGYNNPALSFYVDKVVAFCRVTNLDVIEPPVLYTSAPEKHSAAATANNSQVKTTPQHHLAEGAAAPLPEKELMRQEPAPLAIPNEIKAFYADKKQITEGDTVTLNWHVTGEGHVYLAPVGRMQHKQGSYIVQPNVTTTYELSFGNQKQTLRVQVQKKQVSPAAPEKAPKTAPANAPVPQPKRSSKTPYIIAVVMAILTMAYFVFRQPHKTAQVVNTVTEKPDITAAASTPQPFNTAQVQLFLASLYNAYNSRNLQEIMSHYAGHVTQYYDAASIRKDSLTSIIRDLFVTPAYYSCIPQYKTLDIAPAKQNCKISITLLEQLKKPNADTTDTYTTKIAYVVDTAYKIISEKEAD